MLEKDYKKLYDIQDRFFKVWRELDLPFYLSGGTVLGRFYLHHRYSEDLDFFVNNDDNYSDYIAAIGEKLVKYFTFDTERTVTFDDFTRFFIVEGDIQLKVEFINDVAYRSGLTFVTDFGEVDNVVNILSNKLTAIIGRDEPKDIFDIIYIALSYKFNWKNIFLEAKHKQIINELDIEAKIRSFPVELFDSVNWLIKRPDKKFLQNCLNTITDDFLLGNDNSLCKNNLSIYDAKPGVRTKKKTKGKSKK